MNECKLEKYYNKFLSKQKLLYILKFIDYKHKLHGGKLDENKLALISKLQSEINKKCVKVDKLNHLPLTDLHQINFDNKQIIELFTAIIFNHSKTDTINILLKSLYTNIIQLLNNDNNISKINELLKIEKINDTTDIIKYDNTILITYNNVDNKDYDIYNKTIFTLCLQNDREILDIINNFITVFFDSKINEEMKNKKNKEKIKIEQKRLEALSFSNNIIDIYNKIKSFLINEINLNNILINIKLLIDEKLLIPYNERLEPYKSLISEINSFCSQELVNKSGFHGRQSGLTIENQIYKLLNPSKEYDDILFTNVKTNIEEKVKEEYDIVLGSFDDITSLYDITEIYDIKKTANLINDDFPKFNRAIELLNTKQYNLIK